MKQIVRRLCALLCALLLAVQLGALPARGVLAGVYMISVDDELMRPEQATMPFWSGGRLYVPSTVFQGIYRDLLDVACAVSFNRKTAVLFNASGALTFDLENDTVQDTRGGVYYMTAVERNGTVFFPIDLVVSFFDLIYTYNHTEVVPLIRIKKDSGGLSDARFIDAAKRLMQQYYNEYERAVAPPAPPVESDPPPVVYTGQWVYMVFTFTNADSTRALAAALDRRDMAATFLFTPDQLEEEGELVRTLVGMGHGLGILPDTEEADDVGEELERGNDAIWAAARKRTRMTWLGGTLEEAAPLAEQLGYRSMACLLNYDARPLNSIARAESLYARLSGMDSRNLTLFLGEDHSNTAGLNTLLGHLEAGDCRVLAWRETL